MQRTNRAGERNLYSLKLQTSTLHQQKIRSPPAGNKKIANPSNHCIFTRIAAMWVKDYLQTGSILNSGEVSGSEINLSV